ncbi:MAG: hypothetical protein Q7S92_01285 [Candidatus Diapherotrites archaeon]|nr:hypothetical protein [Candidatus Diapherotrites archaeon]
MLYKRPPLKRPKYRPRLSIRKPMREFTHLLKGTPREQHERVRTRFFSEFFRSQTFAAGRLLFNLMEQEIAKGISETSSGQILGRARTILKIARTKLKGKKVSSLAAEESLKVMVRELDRDFERLSRFGTSMRFRESDMLTQGVIGVNEMTPYNEFIHAFKGELGLRRTLLVILKRELAK